MAASIGVAPVAFTETMPLPLGRLRLTEATFEVSAVAWDGTPVAQPSVLQVRAPDGTVAWMPRILAGPVPAPDATPPVPLVAAAVTPPVAPLGAETAGMQIGSEQAASGR